MEESYDNLPKFGGGALIKEKMVYSNQSSEKEELEDTFKPKIAKDQEKLEK